MPKHGRCINCYGTGSVCRRCGRTTKTDKPCNGASGREPHEFVPCPECTGKK